MNVICNKLIKFELICFSVSFDNMTLEAASLLLTQSPSSPSFLVKYEPTKYKQIYGTPGDHFYVRWVFVRSQTHSF